MNATLSLLPNPFPGLRPFRSDEHHLFFGREAQTAALLQLLRTNRFLAVVGTSGSGKSSLVRAGMIAELHGGTMTQAGSTWEVMILRPGGSPIENLAHAFVDADLYDGRDPSTLPRLLATLNRSRFGLVEAMKQSEVFEPGANLLVVVDQFEELFRFRQTGIDSEEAATAFVNLLLTACAQEESPIYVAITMRSDYLGDCSEIPGLAEAVNDGEYLIPRLLRDQKRDAIEKPIGVGGAKISPLLVQRLLNEAGDDADQLPVLQHALMRMWNVWSAGNDHDRPIDFSDFEATGGLASALSNHADEIYDSLPDDGQRAACERIFKALTEKGADNRGIRRPTRLARLQAIADCDRATATTVLDAYRAAGVTFVMPGPEVPLGDRTVLDLSHESLMRGWQRLRTWVEEEAQSARVFRRLLDTARLWRDAKAGLFRDPDLQIALTWRERETPNPHWAELYGGDFETALGFLEASHAEADAERQAKEAARRRELEQARQLAEAQQLRLEHQKRAAARLRKLLGGLAAFAVIAVLACVAALIANQRARQSAQRAEQSRKETSQALSVVASQKAKAEASEKLARTAEETGRKLLYTTDMRLAPFVWRDDRATAEQLRTLLAKHVPESGPLALVGTPDTAATAKPDLRGFEWYYYQHLLDDSAAVFTGHGASVVDVAFAQGATLESLDQNGQLRHWDPKAGGEDQPLRRDLAGGAGATVRVLSPDGRFVALADNDSLRVLSTSSDREFLKTDSRNAPSRRVTFSIDGERLILFDGKIRWLVARTGEVIATHDWNVGRLQGLALSADGRTLAAFGHGNYGSAFSTFRLDPDKKTITPLARDVVPAGTLSAAALTPDGKAVALAGLLNGYVIVCDATTGRPIAVDPAVHASPVSAVAFSRDGSRLATADVSGTIKIWTNVSALNAKSAPLHTLKGHRGRVNALTFSADDKHLASAGDDKTVRLWNLGDSATFHGGPTGGWAHLSPDAHWVASPAVGAVDLWDTAAGRRVKQLAIGDQTYVTDAAFSPTDRRLLAVALYRLPGSAFVSLWDIDTGRELARLPDVGDAKDDGEDPIPVLKFSPDGKYVVAGFGSRNVLASDAVPRPLKLWDVATRRLVRRLDGHTNYCLSLDFSPDGTLMASGSRDGTAILWSTATWKPLRTLSSPRRKTGDSLSDYHARMIEDVSFSPDGNTLATANRDRNIYLWNVPTGQLLDSLQGHSDAVTTVAFSPDGRTLASGGIDQTVRLWNVQTRRELMQLDAELAGAGQPQSLEFSPDARRLLAGGGRLRVWSSEPPTWDDPDRAAGELRLLLQSTADFKARVRMLSENLRLHEALGKLDIKDTRIRAALAAAQANWHASRHNWPDASRAFDRLLAADPATPADWLRTPGLLRVATALLEENRPAAAAELLEGGAKLRAEDGLPPAVDAPGIGFSFAFEDGEFQLFDRLPGFPALQPNLSPGDAILKVNDKRVTRDPESTLAKLLEKELDTKVRLTLRRPGAVQPETVEVTKARFVQDPATGESLYALRTAINDRLVKEPANPDLLELRAELTGQWSDFKAQAADYAAAIEARSKNPAAAATADLSRLYTRRAAAYASLKDWKNAADDYARVITDKTTDDTLLSDQALAQANAFLDKESTSTWTILKPTQVKSKGGATLTTQPDSSVLASGPNPEKETYTFVCETDSPKIMALRLEAMADPSLPRGGPGRVAWGNFSLSEISVTARPASGAAEPVTLKLVRPRADFGQVGYGITTALDGNSQTGWSIDPRVGENHVAYFEVEPPAQLPSTGRLKLTVTLECQYNIKHALGRFRLAVSPNPLQADRQLKLFATSKLTDPWQLLAATYLIDGRPDAIDALASRRPDLAARVGEVFTIIEPSDWNHAIKLYDIGIKGRPNDVDLLSKRARAHEALKAWNAAAADWSRAATGNPDGAQLLADFAQRLAAELHSDLAKSELEKSEALYTTSLQADPENDVVAEALAHTLLDQRAAESAASWTVLNPTQAKSDPGTPLSILPDHSVLAGGTNPRNDRYRVTFTLEKAIDLVAVRLDALPDPSLPKNGPGRGNDGNFIQARWNVTALPPDHKIPVSLKFENAAGDHQNPQQPIRPDGYWSTLGRPGETCAAIWSNPKPVSLPAGTTLTFDMEGQEQNGIGQNLGRFRVSVAADPAAIEHERKRLALATPDNPWLLLAQAYALSGRNDQATRYLAKVLDQSEEFDTRKNALAVAVPFDDILASLFKARPEDPQLQLAMARSLLRRGKELLEKNQPAAAQFDLEKSRDAFTRLRADFPWTVPTPTQLTADPGVQLTVESDGSIFVSGLNPSRAVYTLTFRPALATLTGIRLETIPDPRLPDHGSGRFGNGNFHLGEITAEILPASGDTRPTPVQISSAMADTTQNSTSTAAQAIDGNPETYWDTYPNQREPHWAVFGFKSPVRTDAGDLRVTLDCGLGEWTQHGLGRFRISVTNKPFSDLQLRQDLKDTELADLYVALGTCHGRQGHADEAATAFAQAVTVSSDRASHASVIDQAARLQGILERIAPRTAEIGQFQAALALHFAGHARADLAAAARANAAAWFESRLARDPDDLASATELARSLLDRQSIKDAAAWTTLTPAGMTSRAGTSLARQADGSVLASGDNFPGDVYTISAPLTVDRVAAVRLEALPDPSLPGEGPGRHTSGNFQLSALRLYRVSGDGARIPVPLASAAASFDYKADDADVAGTVDPKLKKVWHVWGHFGQPNQAVFLLQSPVAIPAGQTFVVELSHKQSNEAVNLGHFRLSVSPDPAIFARQRSLFTAANLTDPWFKLAAAYAVAGEQRPLAALFEHHPLAAQALGDLYAAAHDWDHAIAEYHNLVSARPRDNALRDKLVTIYLDAGRTRQMIPFLAQASAANPDDSLLWLRVGALQAWFGQEQELAATRKRILPAARDTRVPNTAERAAKVFSLIPYTDRADLQAAVALGRKAVELDEHRQWEDWNQLALGMAEFRAGNDAAAERALRAAAAASTNNYYVDRLAAFYRAMCLARQGRADEARTLAINAAANMRPFPADEQNPVPGNVSHDDLIVWTTWRETRTALGIRLSPIEIIEHAHQDQVKTLGPDDPATRASAQKLADAYTAAGRTRDAVAFLAALSAANPDESVLALRVAALQAWFGQAQEYAATRTRILAAARDTTDSGVAERAAKSASILASTRKAELDAALALGRDGVSLSNGASWDLLALGMAQYRSGDAAAAADTLRQAAEVGRGSASLTSIAGFYRAMSLFRQGKPDQARQLATAAAAGMRPLPADDQNPLAGGGDHDDLICWLACKEATATLHFQPPAPPK